MPKPAAERSVVESSSDSAEAPSARSGATLSLLVDGPYLDNLRSTVSETYASLSLDQTGAAAAIEKVVAALARPEVPLDPQLRSALLGHLGELLAKLEQLQAMLPRGERAALETLDRATALLRKIDSQTKG